MEARRIKELTDRQFQRVLTREGKVVTKTDTKEDVTVLFREVKGSSGERISIYYDNNTNLTKGDIIEYKGYKYLLTNENSVQSDVYKVSVLKRCTVLLNIEGRYIPMVIASNLTSDNLGADIINNLGLITKETDFIKNIARNSQYICFGGTYKVVNTFFNDGLAYVYLERTGNAIYGLQEIVYYGNTSFALSDDKVQLRFAMKVGTDKITWSEADIEYKVSNTEFAEIDDQGWLTMKKKGVITVTATCGDVYLKKSITIR